MIALILTLFISLFSIGSPINSLEDHLENSNYYSIPTKNIGYLDEEGFQVAYPVQDMFSSDFFVDFIYYLSLDYGSGMNFNTDTYQRVTLDTDGIFCVFDGGVFDRFDGIQLDTIDVYKTWVTQYPNDLEINYQLTFIGNSTTYLQLQYYVAVPLVDDAEHDYGIQVELVKTSINNLADLYTNKSYCYFENTLDGEYYCPFYRYYFSKVGTGAFSTATAYSDGYNAGHHSGYYNGYHDGYDAGAGVYDGYSPVASSILSSIFDIGLLPVNVFLTIFNFEVFGINIAGIVSGLLTLSVVIIIVRFLLGGKKDD